MADVTPFKYRAFLSYSHRDKRWGEWLHRALETYVIDKDLTGRSTQVGPVSKTLRPIFRDREDFSAGHSLSAQTIAALEASQFLIVVCSPSAAGSEYVNEEIRRFKALGRGDRIIPIIVEGGPGKPDHECFPQALRFKLGPDGSPTGDREEPIAADARREGDGRELAKQKVVAGLLGVGLDEIVRRATRAQRRRNRIWASIAGAFLLLAVTATGSAIYAWQQLKTNEAFLDATLERFTSIVNRAVNAGQTYSLPLRVTLGFLEEAEGMLNVMAQHGRPTPRLRERQIAMLIAFADSYRVLGRTVDAERRIAEAQRLAAALARDDAANPEWRRQQAMAHQRSGDLEWAKGDLAAALREYRSVQAIMERLVQADPDDARWHRSLALALERIGMVQARLGQLAEAFENFKAVLARRQWLANAAPENTERQHELSAIHERIGDVMQRLGDLPAALASFRTALAINQQLAKADPDNAGLQRDLAITHHNVGGILRLQGLLMDALDHLKAALAINERIVKADPQNAEWQHGLSTSHQSIGDVLMSQNKPGEALEAFKALLAIRQRLASIDPNNADWQGDLALSYERLGSVYFALTRNDEAEVALERSLTIYAALLARSPDNAALLIASTLPLMRLGVLHGPDGIPYLEKALAILKQLEATGRLDPRRHVMITVLEDFLNKQRAAHQPAPQ